MPSKEEIMRQGAEIHAARNEALAPLADLMAQRQQLCKALAETEEPYSAAYVAAEAAGWSAIELEALGAEEPARRPKGRPRTPRPGKKSSSASSKPSSKNPETQHDPARKNDAVTATGSAEESHAA